VRPPSLVRLPCGHTVAFHSSGAIPFAGGRFEARMQDGTVTTESSHGRMGSVGRTPTGCHAKLGTGVHTLQTCLIYMYSRVLHHGRAQWIVGSHVLGFLPSPVVECVVSLSCSQGEESSSLYQGRSQTVVPPISPPLNIDVKPIH
jgi:hypothetical protein